MQPAILCSTLKVRLLLFAAFLFIYSTSAAQSAIHGRVLFSDNAPAASANVLLLQAKDTSLVKALVCDNKGTYFFSNVADGHYLIATNHVGYRHT